MVALPRSRSFRDRLEVPRVIAQQVPLADQESHVRGHIVDPRRVAHPVAGGKRRERD